MYKGSSDRREGERQATVSCFVGGRGRKTGVRQAVLKCARAARIHEGSAAR